MARQKQKVLQRNVVEQWSPAKEQHILFLLNFLFEKYEWPAQKGSFFFSINKHSHLSGHGWTVFYAMLRIVPSFWFDPLFLSKMGCALLRVDARQLEARIFSNKTIGEAIKELTAANLSMCVVDNHIILIGIS